MFEAAARNELAALYVVGDDPVERLGVSADTLAQYIPRCPGHVYDGDGEVGRRGVADGEPV